MNLMDYNSDQDDTFNDGPTLQGNEFLHHR